MNSRRPPNQTPRATLEEDAELLNQLVEIVGSVSARELRVDEARDLETPRGRTTTRRSGLPREGALPGVTYRDVRVEISVQGRPDRKRSV